MYEHDKAIAACNVLGSAVPVIWRALGEFPSVEVRRHLERIK
jgi:hypothetical protein